MKHFVGAMDIDGLGEENVRRFLAEGLIERLGRHLRRSRSSGCSSSRASARCRRSNLVAAIEARRQQPFERVLYGLGIPGIGYVNARNLARQPPLDGRAARGDAEDELVEVEGIGPIMARTIAETLAEERTRELIERLRARGLQHGGGGPGRARARGRWSGKTFVLTGTLPEPDPRGGHRARSRRPGGKVTGSVSKKTDYLVAGEDPRQRSDTKAQEVGTEVLDEEALLDADARRPLPALAAAAA